VTINCSGLLESAYAAVGVDLAALVGQPTWALAPAHLWTLYKKRKAAHRGRVVFAT
jgi:hypothetical protein